MTDKKYIVALDQGTTSSRAVVMDHDANIISVSQREFEQIYPKPGWVEHDPMEIWATQSSTLVEVLAKADINSDQIAAIGITNQRETTVVWERETGKPIYNAIVWQLKMLGQEKQGWLATSGSKLFQTHRSSRNSNFVSQVEK